MSSPELFLSNTFLFSAHQLCGEILCNPADDILFRSFRARASGLSRQFLQSQCLASAQCVKEPPDRPQPPDGLSGQGQ